MMRDLVAGIAAVGMYQILMGDYLAGAVSVGIGLLILTLDSDKGRPA